MRNFWKILPAIEALVAMLFLLSWWTPPLAAGEYLRRIIFSGLTSGVFLFGVVNVLIALILSLSNHQKVNEPDLYFQYVSSSAVAPLMSDISSSTIDTKPPASDIEEKTLEGRPGMDIVSNTLETTLTAVEVRPVGREMARAVSSVTETAHAIRRKHEMTFLPPATNDHQVYTRSRSERHDLQGDFGRSMRRFCDIDNLSSDEFRSTVETFIEGKKKMLFKEWMKP